MKKFRIAAVICEFNPFHAGHAGLIKRLKETAGEDTAIVAIMSGNYTQRGEPALFPKHIRAACAVRGGADLVLELPFPYSCSSAERFANAGIHIASSLGVIDMLFFGSECGDMASLYRLAERLESPAFLEAYYAQPEDTNIGCAKKTEVVYGSVYGDIKNDLALLREPNNVLGIEYIRALIRKGSTISPVTFMRSGMRHDEESIPHGEMITGAGAARTKLLKRDCREQVLSGLPGETADVLRMAMENGEILSPENRWLAYCLLHYRHCAPDLLRSCDGMSGGLGDRIIRASQSSRTPDAFFEALRSKKYTDAYLRRALLYGVFGIDRGLLNAPPAYTQILAMNERGQQVLALARKRTTIPLLNRPSEIHHFTDKEKVSLRADSLYCGLLERPSSPADLLRYRPHRENS